MERVIRIKKGFFLLGSLKDIFSIRAQNIGVACRANIRSIFRNGVAADLGEKNDLLKGLRFPVFVSSNI